jgi:hypothetical protein
MTHSLYNRIKFHYSYLCDDEWIPRRFTNVWIRSENDWKLAARQSSEIIRE